MQVSSSVRSLTSAEARETRVPELDRLVLPEDGSSSRRSLVTVFRVDPALPSSTSSSIVRFCPPSPLPLSYSVLFSRTESKPCCYYCYNKGTDMSNEFHEGWAETEREKKREARWRCSRGGITCAGSKNSTRVHAHDSHNGYARRVNERYTVYNSRLPVGFAGKKEKGQRGAMSSDQKRHLSTRGLLYFPRFITDNTNQF